MTLTKEKIVRHCNESVKSILARVKSNKEPKSIIFVLGSGRSGTSILINLLAHLSYVDAHGESSNTFMEDFQLNYERLSDRLSNNKFEVVALKPILNSCDAADILKNYDKSKVIWLFRNYKDVTYSALKKFGDRVAVALKKNILENENEGWISDQIHDEERRTLENLDSTEFTNTDWMALVWWFVNHTVFRQELFKRSDFMLLEYNDFVKNPETFFQYINEFGSLKKNNLHKYIDSSRIGKGKQVDLNKSVELMCDDLFKELRKHKLKYNKIKSLEI